MKFIHKDDLTTVLNQLPKVWVVNGVQHPLRQLWNKGHTSDVTKFGWQGVETPIPEYDQTTHKLGDITYSLNAGIISGEYAIVPLTFEEKRVELQAERDANLNSMTHTFSDGTAIQVRPADLTNFNIAISVGQDRDWIMADNSVRLTTVTEMQEALNSGIYQGQVIWNNYAQDLKNL